MIGDYTKSGSLSQRVDCVTGVFEKQHNQKECINQDLGNSNEMTVKRADLA